MPGRFISPCTTSRCTRHVGLAIAILLLQACAALTPPVKQPAVAAGAEKTPGKTAAQQHVIPPATNVPTKAADLFAKATRALAANDLSHAGRYLEELTSQFPQYASPFTDLGLVYAKTGRDDDALAAFAKAIKIQPADCRAQVQSGILYRQRHQFVAAENAYKACLAHNPDYPPALLNLGILYEIYMGKWQDALASYQHYQSLQEKPDKRVAGWIAALSRRIEHATNTIAQRGPAR